MDTSESESPRYQATVVKTAHGIPHITANDWGSLGFAEAYSAAEDHVCNMALALLQSRGESAESGCNIAFTEQQDPAHKIVTVPAILW